MQSKEHQELIISGLVDALKATPDTPEYDHQRERYTEIIVIKVIILNSDMTQKGDRLTYSPYEYELIKRSVVSTIGVDVSDAYLKRRIRQVKSRKWLGRQRLLTRLKKPSE